MGKPILTIIGGDKRQSETANILADAGHFSIKAYGFPDPNNNSISYYRDLNADLFDCRVLLLPVPYKNKEGFINIINCYNNPLSVAELFENLSSEILVLLGKADKEFCKLAQDNSITFYDILQEESFSVLNAVPSAEGAVQRAMERTDITIHGSNTLILGFGRLGRALARMLKGIGANVTIGARKAEDLAWARESCYNHVHFSRLDGFLKCQDIIFNTVPAMILDRDRLEKIDPHCIIIDLASWPGGTNFQAAREYGIRADLDLGLPGIVAPRTAAHIICQVMTGIVKKHLDITGG